MQYLLIWCLLSGGLEAVENSEPNQNQTEKKKPVSS